MLRSITFICIIHNVESVNVSLVTDNEHIKKHKDMRRAITFFIIHDVEPVLFTDDEQVKAHKVILRFVKFFPRLTSGTKVSPNYFNLSHS